MEEKKYHKKKKWIKFRHRMVIGASRYIVGPIMQAKYHAKCRHFDCSDGRRYLILMNHQTPADQIFCGIDFDHPIYYVATEDIFSNGIISRLLEWAVAPIPIDKTKLDISTIRNCRRIAAEGGSIAIAPEGNRTYSGKTCEMKSTIAGLAKLLKLPVAFLRIEGGYGVQPRWSDSLRKGRMFVGVSRVIEPEEYAAMSDDELFETIKNELYVDDAAGAGRYRSKKRAEYMERAVCVCPKCGFAPWESKGSTAHCTSCGMTVEYGEDLRLYCDDPVFPFRTFSDWCAYQNDFFAEYLPKEGDTAPLFRDEKIKVRKVIPYKHKQTLAKNGELTLYSDRMVFSGKASLPDWSFDRISGMAVMGRNKLNVQMDGTLCQFSGTKRFNALKYMSLWQRYQNIKRGNQYGSVGI